MRPRLRKALTWGLLGVALLGSAAAIASVVVSRPLFDETLEGSALESIAIAPPDQALTFARYGHDGATRVLLVTRYAGGRVSGLDLNHRLGAEERDPIALFRRFGYDALAREAASPVDVVTIDASALGVPFRAPEQNIGVGLNYREHTAETSLDEEPFLFPKFARPTGSRSDVAKNGSARLDYEVELGLVALGDLRAGDAPATLGLVVTNEITDRWPLVRGLKRSEPMGTTGFADGKSREGFAPIGPLLVIPRDVEAFCRNIELRLYVNDRLRQRDKASSMLWGPKAIVAEAFRRADWKFRYGNRTVRLLGGGSGDAIPAGTILFSGTPAGVVFRPLNLWNPWVYLRPGDRVAIRADFLGVIRNRIVE